MHRHLSYILVFIVFGGYLLAGCSKSNDQRDFENQARSEPENITKTDGQGNVVSSDPDDWRVGPTYRGLISIGTPDNQPPYPNPLPFNQDLTINIYIRSIETLNRIEVYAFETLFENSTRITVRENFSSPTLETITLSGEAISSSSGGSQASGLYRLLIYDGQQNLITYGDVCIDGDTCP